jgi:hypothetical protein
MNNFAGALPSIGMLMLRKQRDACRKLLVQNADFLS